MPANHNTTRDVDAAYRDEATDRPPGALVFRHLRRILTESFRQIGPQRPVPIGKPGGSSSWPIAQLIRTESRSHIAVLESIRPTDSTRPSLRRTIKRSVEIAPPFRRKTSR
jgi:hypothetical protein